MIGVYEDRYEATLELDHILDTGRSISSRYEPESDSECSAGDGSKAAVRELASTLPRG